MKINTFVRHNYLLLEEIVQERKSSGGLILSENDVKSVGMKKAKVIDVGPQTTGAVEVGDVAIYSESSADKVEVDGDVFIVIAEPNIVLIQREEFPTGKMNS